MRSAQLLAAFSAILSACASTVYEGKYAWEEGWRQAKVEKVGTGSELGGRAAFDCSRSLPQAQVRSSQFALLGLVDFGRHRHQLIPLERGQALSKGDEVITNIRRCDPPIARSSK